MAILNEGATLRDTYEVERFVGEGAFAEVYRVKHRFLGRQAMKVFKRTGMNLDEIQNMLGEAILLSKIGHPNIVRVFDANIVETEKGTCGYFTMEHVSGGSLDKMWRSYGNRFMPIETAVDLTKQVCRGIAQAHGEKPPIIHRDIKPQNILVGYEAEGLRARVSDFGLAKQVNPLTLLATAAGTLAFKPPEAFQEHKGDSCAADVWAIGATLYLVLTDRLPFPAPEGTSWGSGAKVAFEASLTPASELRPDVDSKLDAIIAKTLEKKPGNRYANARELLMALENWKPCEESTPARTRASASSEPSKAILGSASPQDDRAGQDLAKKAVSLGRAGRLGEAADVMEEAFNKSPDLRSRYANQVKLWRCGISM
jgi:serine/threonine-protein kinase